MLIYWYELTIFSPRTVKGRTVCFSTKKNSVRVVLNPLSAKHTQTIV